MIQLLREQVQELAAGGGLPSTGGLSTFPSSNSLAHNMAAASLTASGWWAASGEGGAWALAQLWHIAFQILPIVSILAADA